MRMLLPIAGIAAVLLTQAASDPWTIDGQERFLLTAQIVSVAPAGKGLTGTKKAILSDGHREHAAHIQTIDIYTALFRGRDGSTEADFKDTWKFNVAAYRLAKLLHLTNMVPVSVARPYEGTPASFSWWVDDVMMDERDRISQRVMPSDIPEWNRQMGVIRIFDQLIYNVDRSQENLLITKDWHVWMIDHTRAFRKWPALRRPEAVMACDPALLEQLKALRREVIADTMGDLLTDEEVDGLILRRDLIVQRVYALAGSAGAGQ
jgi:hypothetical protein